MTAINNGNATLIWYGITHNELLARCAQANEQEASAMSHAAATMAAGECSEQEWLAAESALRTVERRLCAAWEAENGAPECNRFGRIIGGRHPALNASLYAEALANRARQGQK